MADRADLKAKIAALRAKTVDNGCTEAEALAAATLAARLMAEHGLDDDDLEIGEAGLVDEAPNSIWQGVLSYTIATCTGTERGFGRRKDGAPLVVFKGKSPGPELAAYLRDICFRASEQAIATYECGLIFRSIKGQHARRMASAAFADAMAQRLSERLTDIFGEVIALRLAHEKAKSPATEAPPSDSRALVRRSHAGYFSDRPTAARRAGLAAADGVALNRGIDGAAETRRIGRG